MSVDGGFSGKTIGQRIEEARMKSGAQKYAGHDIMDLMRFDENTRHMIVFDIQNECRFGYQKGRNRLFLTEQGYNIAKDEMGKGNIKILNHAKVSQGRLKYDSKDQVL